MVTTHDETYSVTTPTRTLLDLMRGYVLRTRATSAAEGAAGDADAAAESDTVTVMVVADD